MPQGSLEGLAFLRSMTHVLLVLVKERLELLNLECLLVHDGGVTKGGNEARRGFIRKTGGPWVIDLFAPGELPAAWLARVCACTGLHR